MKATKKKVEPTAKKSGVMSNKSGQTPPKKSPIKMKDLSGDGKVTQKDVLIGRGVIKSPIKQMMKRADGSTSEKGLWDNIRANKGSGKKPTKEMLKEAKKITNKKK